MFQRICFIIGLVIVFCSPTRAQHIYYKNPDAQVIMQFHDSANRVINVDSAGLLKKQFNYVLKFYPKMLVKNIVIKYNTSSSIVKTKPKFSSIFKMPAQRVYVVSFSKRTKTTLDSVLLDNLSFNSQLGLIANQVSQIEDMSTGGFFNFIGWYFKQLSHKGKKTILTDAEEKTVEVGLGYQLLSYNRECKEKLRIDNWLTTKGYTNYTRHYRNREMKPQLILNLINDMPVYVSKAYK